MIQTKATTATATNTQRTANTIYNIFLVAKVVPKVFPVSDAPFPIPLAVEELSNVVVALVPAFVLPLDVPAEVVEAAAVEVPFDPQGVDPPHRLHTIKEASQHTLLESLLWLP
jgi:hypothetical protein